MIVPQETYIINPNEQGTADVAGHSLREIQQQVFGDAGGAVKQV